jgi:hypothetical protein
VPLGRKCLLTVEYGERACGGSAFYRIDEGLRPIMLSDGESHLFGNAGNVCQHAIVDAEELTRIRHRGLGHQGARFPALTSKDVVVVHSEPDDCAVERLRDFAGDDAGKGPEASS